MRPAPLRRPDRLDEWLDRVQTRLSEGSAQPAAAEAELSPNERRHAAALMRVNHAGEVAAQGLYLGQAAQARRPAIREHLLQAAEEEKEHLRLCRQRLDELGSAPSLLDPLWFAGSYALGATAARFGDAVSLGFVAETEAQVEQHLDSHLQRLPPADQRS
ncbi:MAG: 2-polyprenyl-3-methyl-6-methoxy-1,4-benzoquinone monooxygenase, partial [Oceanococcaceae bacterium]